MADPDHCPREIAVGFLTDDANMALEAAKRTIGDGVWTSAEMRQHLQEATSSGALAYARVRTIGHERRVQSHSQMRRIHCANYPQDDASVVDE